MLVGHDSRLSALTMPAHLNATAPLRRDSTKTVKELALEPKSSVVLQIIVGAVALLAVSAALLGRQFLTYFQAATPNTVRYKEQ